MAAMAEVGTSVDVDGVTLYDLQGKAAELAAARLTLKQPSRGQTPLRVG